MAETDGQAIGAAGARGALQGALWLCTAGAALIVGGVVALLAANWHTVPFGAQVGVALAPLALAWVGFGWVMARRRRGEGSLAAEEVLGVVWVGGVLCAVALLGRVLQLASDAFAFCATMAVLLLPVAYAVRSTAGWVACAGFGIAAACVARRADVPWEWLTVEAWRASLFAATVAVLAPRVAPFWRRAGWYALGQQWLGAIAATVAAVGFAFAFGAACEDALRPWLGHDVAEGWAVAAAALALAAPLAVGAVAERGRGAGRRPLSLFGGLTVAIDALFLMAIADVSFFREAIPLAAAIAVAVLVGATARWTFRDEGILLAALPIALLALALDFFGLALGGLLAVGIALMVAGVATGRRMAANEGLLFVVATAWVGFVAIEADLALRGLTLIGGGVLLVAMNVVLAVVTRRKGGRHA